MSVLQREIGGLLLLCNVNILHRNLVGTSPQEDIFSQSHSLKNLKFLIVLRKASVLKISYCIPLQRRYINITFLRNYLIQKVEKPFFQISICYRALRIFN